MLERGNGKTIDLTRYARILIAVAIFFLVYGFFLDLGGTRKLMDPISAIKGDVKKGESITTIDIAHWNDDINEVDLEGQPMKPNSGGQSGGNSSGNSSGSGSPVFGGGSHSSASSGIIDISGGETNQDPTPGGSNPVTPTPEPTQPEPEPQPPSIHDENAQLRSSIESRYGITVKYGNETAGYVVGGLTTNVIADPYVVNDNLNRLNTALGLYPNGFFREIKNGGIPLTVYLVDSYSVYGVTGVTDSNYSFANISVAVAHPFEETFYHESYHYIERYMFKQGISFSSWNGFNPPDFTYNSLDRHLSYTYSYSEDAYFVNDYAQTSAEEDRASTFEYMMAASKASCLNPNKPVWRKATAMSNSIDAALNTVTPTTTEYWERHL